MRLIYKEGGRSHDYFLREGKNTIGRSPKLCHLVLFDSSVSKKHVNLYYRKKRNEVIIKDLGSSNGTLINGQRVREVVLAEGDVIKIGQTKLLFTKTEEEMSGTDVDGIFGAGEEELEASALRPYLFVEDKEGETTVPLGFENVTIGHKSGNDIRVKGTGVSRFHAEIYFDNNSWWVKDLNSRNGTYLNSLKVEEDEELSEGDVIQVGNVLLTFEFPREDTLLDHFKNLDLTVKIPLILGTLFVVGIFLAVFLQGNSPPPPTKASTPLYEVLEKGLGLLTKEKYDEASEFFKKALVKRKSKSLKLLQTISPDLDTSNLKVEKLASLEKRINELKEALKKEVPDHYKPITKFFDRKVALIKKEKDNYRRFRKAMKIAQNHELAKIKQAYWLFNKIDQDSRFYQDGKREKIRLQEIIRKKLRLEAEYLSNNVDPNWAGAEKKYKEALKYSENDTTFETEIQTKIQECRMNELAKDNFLEGRRFYQQGQLVMALNIFERIPENSFYYAKALQMIKDIKEYNRLIDARRLYEQGAGDEALKKLRPLSDIQATSLKKRIEKVRRYMTLGEKAKSSDEYRKAMRLFKRVLKIEDNSRNYYRIAAKKQFRECEREAKSISRKNYQQGIQALDNGDYGKALTSFELAVRNDLSENNEYLSKIRSNLRYRANEMMSAARSIRRSGNTYNYPKAKNMLKILKQFLKRSDPRRDKAAQMLRAF